MYEANGYVYLIKSQNRPVVKIGKAKDPIERVKQIQTGSPDLLYLYAAIYSENSVLLESQFHTLLANDWIRGEWFNFTKDTEAIIYKYCEENSLTITRVNFVWHEQMMCHLQGFQISAPNYLLVFLRDGDSCDKSGCIYLAKKILPKVEVI